ncbi:NAD(P)H-binding protein [Spiroplasma chinense]|uniref:NAD(P)H-binding protein n=1 Tax=Spiroplasma chinense TaxID=216932 RepID=A0A5B9Y2F5_9MOLU|nr:NAD(P)H-binding protein [Spiroplasma chinense]QEH61244.1 NAD(P)H-binding protein [Spiroplasma chinense]
MKILILGAAGRISELVTARLLERDNVELVLFARDANRRISNQVIQKENVKVINGDFSQTQKMHELMLEGVEKVYVNAATNIEDTISILEAAKGTKVNKLIWASAVGIYDEIEGPFADWHWGMVGGKAAYKKYYDAMELVEKFGIDYSILRYAWMHNKKNEDYELTQKGEKFKGVEISRNACAKLVEDIIFDDKQTFKNTSLGVSEPNTDFDKPSFY